MTALQTSVAELHAALDRLARFEPVSLPVISLYVNLTANERGKDHYEPFVKKALHGRARTYPLRSAARQSFDRDMERIEEYLADRVPASANGIALFACFGVDEFFEALTLDTPVDHRLSVSNEPHLYPLARVLDEHPPHAVVLADSHAARLFVFAAGHKLRSEVVPGQKINRSAAGGWSQMRYQRHVDKLQADHTRELVAALDRLVRQEAVEHIVLAGDDVNIPLVKGELSKELAAKIVDVVRLEPKAPEHEIMAVAAEVLQRHDARTDAEAVERVLGEYRAGGLATAGPEETYEALANGQVDELLLASPAADGASTVADDLVTKARQTSARVRFIEESTLLADVGGVAASLRYRLDGPPSDTQEAGAAT